jgi:uncharacterized protein (DUF1697 family)
MEVHTVLLRGIGPPTHAKLTMTALAAACRDSGLPETVNLLATGNLIVRSNQTAVEVEAIVLGHLASAGVMTKAIMCDRERIGALVRLCPDALASDDRPSEVQVTFLSHPLTDASLAILRSRAGPERLERIGTDLWIDYCGPIAQSKLTTKVIERVTRTVGTARNWNTVRRLVALVG